MMAADIIPKVEIDDHQLEQSKITKEELSSMSNQALLEKMRNEMLKRISNNLISNKRLVHFKISFRRSFLQGYFSDNRLGVYCRSSSLDNVKLTFLF